MTPYDIGYVVYLLVCLALGVWLGATTTPFLVGARESRRKRKQSAVTINQLEADVLFGTSVDDIVRQAEREGERLHWAAFPDQKPIINWPASPASPADGPAALPPIDGPFSWAGEPTEAFDHVLQRNGRCANCQWDIITDRTHRYYHAAVIERCPQHETGAHHDGARSV